MDINYTDPRVLAGDFTPQEKAFLFGVDRGNTKYKQDTAEASFGGDAFNLPYGAVGFALGAQWRRDSIRDVPGEATDPNLMNNIWGSTTSGITAGHETSKEIFGEVEVPVLRNLPFVHDLTLNGAARMTNVEAVRADGERQSNNGNWTYKVAGNYSPTNWLRLRATYGTSFRSPALFEEFLANEVRLRRPEHRPVHPLRPVGQCRDRRELRVAGHSVDLPGRRRVDPDLLWRRRRALAAGNL